jgi:FkbM family methyltransferase
MPRDQGRGSPEIRVEVNFNSLLTAFSWKAVANDTCRNHEISSKHIMNLSKEKIINELKRRTHEGFQIIELDETERLCEILYGCRSFADVGANWGQYSWVANLVLSNATITSVEANPELCSYIEKQAKDIESDASNNGNRINVVNAAVSDKSGSVKFGVDKDDCLNSIMGDIAGEKAEHKNLEIIDICAMTLDEIFGTIENLVGRRI